MSLTTVNVDVRDGWAGTRNTELDGLLIRGDELTIRGCEFLSGLIKQSTKGGGMWAFLSPSSPLPSPLCGCSLKLFSSFQTILVLHLLVIHAYTWVHTLQQNVTTVTNFSEENFFITKKYHIVTKFIFHH